MGMPKQKKEEKKRRREERKTDKKKNEKWASYTPFSFSCSFLPKLRFLPRLLSCLVLSFRSSFPFSAILFSCKVRVAEAIAKQQEGTSGKAIETERPYPFHAKKYAKSGSSKQNTPTTLNKIAPPRSKIGSDEEGVVDAV